WTDNTFGVTEFEALPQAAKNYIKRLEELTGVPVDIVSTGPDRNETIVLRSPYDA
ncbi:MAG: adenylosuccinate synthetase, partial [Pseudomonadota bacterium]|nr:adenylosuccinate synthetase [Pseudomonadota bacterium]